MQILSIKDSERILIVAPHPDDECIGAGGVLIRFPKQSDVVVLTDGALGQGQISPELERKKRKDEFICEMEMLGIENYKMLDIPDGTLMQHTDCLMNFDLSQYTKIFVTGSRDGHPDHTAAYVSVVNALKEQKEWKKEVFVYEVHSPLQSPTHMLDITDAIETKQKLIRIHSSQTKYMAYDKYAKVSAEYRALQQRYDDRYIEVYSLVRFDEKTDECLIEMERKLQKQIQFYQALTKWLELKINNINIAYYLEKEGYKTVAIYGYKELGKLLYQELQYSNLNVMYIIDKNNKNIHLENIDVLAPQKKLPQVDTVIVTAIYYFEEIREELENLGFANIISLTQLLDEYDGRIE